MKKYINTSNYYLSTIASSIPSNTSEWTFDVSDVTADWVILPTSGYYWVDVDFGDVSKREIFRITKREWYTLFYDKRISPYGRKMHSIWATVGLRDFSELLNSLSTNTDNFWEVEKVNETWFDVIVRGGKVFLSWSADNIVDIKEDWKDYYTLTIPASSEKYIVLDFSDELWLEAAEFVLKDELTPDLMYPVAKVTTNENTIISIEDLRSTVIGWWDMRKAVFDPTGVADDAFNYENFYNVPTQETWDISDISDRNNKRWYWNDKQEELVSWQNIVTINGKSIIDISQWEWGNIPLDTILTAGWETAKSTNWANTFVFWVDSENVPLTEDAFIVFSDSGTMLTKGWEEPNDYTYNNDTHTITFNNPLASNEHAIVWAMYNNTDSVAWIWSWTIQLQRNWVTIPNWQFNVNQDDVDWHPQTIELWWLPNDSTITFTQWAWANWDWETLGTMTTNQSSASSINVKWNIAVTQEEYDELPESKETDGNRYFIYEE